MNRVFAWSKSKQNSKQQQRKGNQIMKPRMLKRRDSGKVDRQQQQERVQNARKKHWMKMEDKYIKRRNLEGEAVMKGDFEAHNQIKMSEYISGKNSPRTEGDY